MSSLILIRFIAAAANSNSLKREKEKKSFKFQQKFFLSDKIFIIFRTDAVVMLLLLSCRCAFVMLLLCLSILCFSFPLWVSIICIDVVAIVGDAVVVFGADDAVIDSVEVVTFCRCCC